MRIDGLFIFLVPSIPQTLNYIRAIQIVKRSRHSCRCMPPTIYFLYFSLSLLQLPGKFPWNGILFYKTLPTCATKSHYHESIREHCQRDK